jgi:MFS family permease
MGAATVPLAAHQMLGADKSLATLPQFIMQVGITASTVPASLLMDRIGRRGGFSLGALAGIIGGTLGTLAVFQHNFVLLCIGTFFVGSAAAFAWYFRFAAADAADTNYRARAISLVLAGGVFAGFLGPQTAKWSVDMFAPVTFAGVFVMVAVFGFLTLLIIQGLRIPTLSAAEKAEGGRPLLEIMKQPAYIAALSSSMFGYGVMTLVMVATPLAMLGCGYAFGDSATVIQFHAIAMFLPSFATGRLIQKFGVLSIITAGALIEIGCAVVNLMGIDYWNFMIANILVGLGWNFTYIGGTTLLTTTYRPAERARVQASHDFIVYTTTATAAGLSGILQAKAGWNVINFAALPMLGAVLLTTLWYLGRQRRDAAAAVAAE